MLLSYSVFRISTYGLETPLYIILFGLCVGLTVRGIRSTRDAALFGAIAGLTALARIDFLVVLAGFVALETLRRRMRRADALVSGLVAGLVCSPWFAFVYSNTGHLMPTGRTGPDQLAVTRRPKGSNACRTWGRHSASI